MENRTSEYLCQQPEVGAMGCIILGMGMADDLKIIQATPELVDAVVGGALLYGEDSRRLREGLCVECPIWSVLNKADQI